MKRFRTLLQCALMVIVTVGAALFLALAVHAEDCPPGAKACKVLTLTPEEETSLTGTNMVLDSAVFANRIQMEGIARYWRDKLQQAHQGVVKPAEEVKPNPALPPRK